MAALVKRLLGLVGWWCVAGNECGKGDGGVGVARWLRS